VLLNIQVSCDVTVCRLMNSHRRFEGAYCLHLPGQAVRTVLRVKQSFCPLGQAVRTVLRVKQSELSFGSSSRNYPSGQAVETVLRVKQSCPSGQEVLLSFGSCSLYCPSGQVFSDSLPPMMKALRSFKAGVVVH
jgi:hypothetical protein